MDKPYEPTNGQADQSPPPPTDQEIQALQTATRDLIGVALRSLDLLAGEVSLPQFRLMLALGDLGRVPSSQVAEALGVGASSVTRLADKLHASGHLTRGTDEHHRSVVTLELTERGHRLVDEVLAWRHDELGRLLATLPAGLRAATAEGLTLLHHAIGERTELLAQHGPVPL
ncbi:MarR family winged helix-turn-helix transcriptional regulator [Kitasatospora viridis]|uniref:MarR family transcriptional regulator n=1 Tax=Kitasatospora viridis TaxID=281105 RepID=A0A561UPP1_9ACTN|nr:MarR family transcriptional regulator [Kitasatospora viridis]TWG01333.1 MarR family transcriptional regulator [Kitasatospora viridis]